MIGLLRRLIWLGGAVFVLTFIAVSVAAALMERRHGDGRGPAEPVDAIIVLSAWIDPDGVLSFPTRRRVIAAVQALSAGKTKLLIMSGGKPGFKMPPLAEMMRDYAVSLGAPADKILVEGKSATTLQNIRYSVPIARDAGAQKLAILTDHFHLLRADMLAWAMVGERFALVSASGMERTHWMDQVKQIGREAMAWWYNLGKVALWHGMAYAGYSEDERAQVVR